MNSTKYQTLVVLGIVVAAVVGIYWSIETSRPQNSTAQVQVVTMATNLGQTNLSPTNLFELITNGRRLEVPTIPPQQIVR